MRDPGNIRKILNLLAKAYGRQRHFKKTPAVDELIRTVLSQNTSDVNSLKAFDALKKDFRTWERLLRADTVKIARSIEHAGLANIKSGRIKGILAEIKRREGRISLARLSKMGTEEAGAYLRSLKGVGPKTAACVLLFSFARPVMPVDTHIFRVTKRLGIVGGSVNIEEAHRILSAAVPRGLIYEFHLGIIEHGRRTCKAQDPRCGSCVLYKFCVFEQKTFYREKGYADKKG